MKIRVHSESKHESHIPPATAEEAKNSANYQAVIVHRFGALIVDPQSEGWGMSSHFDIPAESLPADTKIGDEFVVSFNRVS